MKKVMIVCFLLFASPAFSWYDAYGGFTCGYMDPLTSFLDNIFGLPCPPRPVAIVEPQQTIIQQQVTQQYPQNNSWFPWW